MKQFTKDDLRKHFVYNFQFYLERNCINLLTVTNNYKEKGTDLDNMRRFGEGIAKDERELFGKDGLKNIASFCRGFLSINKSKK